MRPLRITARLGAGETPASFTARLAAANRLSAREFWLDWGIHFQAIVDGRSEAIGTIAKLGRASADALVAHTFVRAEGWSYTHRGQRLVRQALTRSRIHICRACLKADIEAEPQLAPEVAAYGRATWLIEVIKTCPEHGIALVEIANDLTPRSLDDFTFHIARSLPRLESLLDHSEARQPNGLERYVLARLNDARVAPFLDAMPLYAAAKACEMIGAVEVFGRTPHVKRLSDDEWWRAGAVGFNIAAGGAEAIGSFLAELQRTYPYSRSSNEVFVLTNELLDKAIKSSGSYAAQLESNQLQTSSKGPKRP